MAIPTSRSSRADAAGTARLILRYGADGGGLIAASMVAARPPAPGAAPPPGSDGAWLIVRDRDGAVAQAVPLPDPRHGHEAIDEAGALGRVAAAGDDGGERTHAVEVRFPGPGATFEVHLGGLRAATRGGGGAIVLSGPLAPAPARRAFDPALIEHPGPAGANPNAKTLLFLPDGFAAAEMALFRAAIDGVVTRMRATEPFGSRPETLRVAHVEIPSVDSGIAGAEPRDTAFRGRFTIDRVIEADQARAAAAIERYCSGRSAVALICANTRLYGGSGGAATVFSRHPDWMAEIAIHELGHGWFHLADEYSAGGQAATMAPVEANVSGTAERARLKWAAQVKQATPLPTTSDDPRGRVGAFEGAKYRENGIFRPAFDCKMRTPGVPFCAVCAGIIDEELKRHAA